MAATPKPAEADEEQSWKNTVDYAKQVDTYSEYALYAAALSSTDPKTTIELSEMLMARNPTGEYGLKARQSLFLAYRQSGASDKALALAEQTLQTDQSNEDMLLVVTDHYLQTKKESEKAHAYAAKIVEVMSAKPKPAGISDADWNLRKGLGYYYNGKLYFNENKFGPADEQLRKALPLVESNAALKSEVLFMLGQANYKLEKPQEAANYFRACAALKSGLQAQAATNLAVIKRQYTGIK
jgi:tetratricopeptide (TPR) repeat protein